MPSGPGGAAERPDLAAPLLFWALAAVVLIAPLPFGAVQPAVWGPLVGAVALIVALWGLVVLLRGRPWAAGFGGRLWIAGLPFGLAVAWALVQAASGLPAALHHPVWAEASAALGRPLAGTISLDPAATLFAAGRLLGYGAVVLAACHLVGSERRARRCIAAFVLAATGTAAYGLAVHLAGSETVLWHDKTAYLGSVTGTFINRNSFATFCGLALVCATALLLDRMAESAAGEPGRRERRVRLLTLPARTAVWLLAWMVLITALLLSQSRAGLASALVGVLAVFAGFAWSRRISWRAAAVMALPLLLAGAVFAAVGGEGTWRRLLLGLLRGDQRPEIYDAMLAAIAERPWLGSGLGTFRDAFTRYQPETVRGLVELGHNSYLELAMELGLPAAALLALAVLALAGICLGGLRRRRRGVIFPAIGLAASVLVGLHATVDFSLQIPAVALGYALLMGLAVRGSFRDVEPRHG